MIKTIGEPFVWIRFVKLIPRERPRFVNPKLKEQQAEYNRMLVESLSPMTEQQLESLRKQQQYANAQSQFGSPYNIGWGLWP